MGRASRRKQDQRAAIGRRPDGAELIVARLRDHTASVEDAYPRAWEQLATLRRRSDTTSWPTWCWLPLAAAHAVVTTAAAPAPQTIASPLAPPDMAGVAVVGALGAWRQTKTIYRFDPDLYRALLDTQLADRLPPQAFYRLPEWCPYIALPQPNPVGRGFFAHLEWDLNTQRPELRLLCDRDPAPLAPLILYLDRPTISESLTDVLATTLANAADPSTAHDIHSHGDLSVQAQWAARARQAGVPDDLITQALTAVRDTLHAACSTLLYLCAEDRDIVNPDEPPDQASWTSTPPGPAAKPRVWEVGWRLGAALRIARARTPTQTGEGGSPRPHIRRAHWHHYWTGPRNTPDERRLTLKWLAPIPVNLTDPDQLVPTIHNIAGADRA